MSLPSRPLALLFVTAALVAACDTAPAPTTPSPAPTVTTTVTEYVTEDPTTPPTTQDACAALEDGESMAFVFVTWPTSGTTVQSGFTVTGCANTFEAAYSWRLKDGSGAILASGFGTATCGTGCVGTFTQPVSYTVSETQVGTLEVYTASAEDGSDQHLNAIPLVLEP